MEIFFDISIFYYIFVANNKNSIIMSTSKHCLNCKHYICSPRGCKQGNNDIMLQWWKNNGTKKLNDTIEELECCEFSSYLIALDNALEKVKELSNILKEKRNDYSC